MQILCIFRKLGLPVLGVKYYLLLELTVLTKREIFQFGWVFLLKLILY